MKICFYCDTIFSFGGVQRVLGVLAAALSKKYDVTILTMDSKAQENRTLYGMDDGSISYKYISFAKLPFYEFFPCKSYSFLYKYLLPKTKFTTKWYGYSSFPKSQREKLIREINESNYDIIVGVHVFLSFQLASIKEKIKAKTIGWLHTSFIAFFTGPKPYIKNQEKRFAYQMPLLDRIVVLSNYDKTRFFNELNVKTLLIPNPLTITPFLNKFPSSKRFLAVGRLVPLTKGFDILINAFAEFSTINREWTLDIVGEGPEEPMLKSLIIKHQLQNRISIHPFTIDIEKYYSQADVFILSSRWEGFPLVLLEAMIHRLPIIASRIPITEELIEDKGFSVMFENENVSDLASKMLFMANNPNLDEMGERAFIFTKEFRLEEVVEKWDRLFEEILTI